MAEVFIGKKLALGNSEEKVPMNPPPPELFTEARRVGGISKISPGFLDRYGYEVVEGAGGVFSLRRKEEESAEEKDKRCKKILSMYSGYIAEQNFEKLHRHLQDPFSSLKSDAISTIGEQALQLKNRGYRIYPPEVLEGLWRGSEVLPLISLVVNMVTDSTAHTKTMLRAHLRKIPTVDGIGRFRNHAFREPHRIDPMILKELRWVFSEVAEANIRDDVSRLDIVIRSLENTLKDFDYIDIGEDMPPLEELATMKDLFTSPFWYLQFHEDDVRVLSGEYRTFRASDTILGRLQAIFAPDPVIEPVQPV